MKVERLMARGVESCRADDSMNRAAEIMWDHDCGTVPVVDEQGQAIGMITDRDVCMAAYTRGKALAAMRVGEAMSRTVVSCRPDDALTDAQALIRKHRVRRLPVVDGVGKLVGMLSLNDIFREMAHDRGRIGMDEVLTTAAAVSEPRHARTETIASVGIRSKRVERTDPLLVHEADSHR